MLYWFIQETGTELRTIPAKSASSNGMFPFFVPTMAMEELETAGRKERCPYEPWTDVPWPVGVSWPSASCSNTASQQHQQGRWSACGAWWSQKKMARNKHEGPCLNFHSCQSRGPWYASCGQSCPTEFVDCQQQNNGTSCTPSGFQQLQHSSWPWGFLYIWKASASKFPSQLQLCLQGTQNKALFPF